MTTHRNYTLRLRPAPVGTSGDALDHLDSREVTPPAWAAQEPFTVATPHSKFFNPKGWEASAKALEKANAPKPVAPLSVAPVLTMESERARLLGMTRDALRKLAKACQFKGYSKWRKAELVERLAAQAVAEVTS